MKSSHYRIISLFLLLLGSAPLLFSITLLIKKGQIRSQMKERMEKTVLHTLLLDEDKVIWIKPGKEIYVAGKMFDIKESKKQNDGRILFYGLYDEEETALKKNLDTAMEKENSRHQKLLTNLFSLIFGVFHDNADTYYPVYDLKSSKRPQNILSLAKQVLTVITPPPDIA